MIKPTVEDVLSFIPKGRSVNPKEWVYNVKSAGFDITNARLILQRLLDPEDLALVDVDRNMHYILK